jgi:urease accessory protein
VGSASRTWGILALIEEKIVKALALTAVLSSLAGPALAHHVMGGDTPVTFSQGLLSGLGHPIIGLDHLAAVIAVGCLAASQARGALLAIGYVVAMMIGAAAHIGEATIAGAEIFVALSVVALGAVLIRATPVRIDIAVALFACAGLLHGYALGESIAGAEPGPRYGYFIGLAVIQTAIALAAMAAARTWAARAAKPAAVRLLGAAVACIGLVLLAQQIVAAA